MTTAGSLVIRYSYITQDATFIQSNEQTNIDGHSQRGAVGEGCKLEFFIPFFSRSRRAIGMADIFPKTIQEHMWLALSSTSRGAFST